MVDAADLVVQGKGKFEELMVCSHEIAASTAQLVAASKVGALPSHSPLYTAWAYVCGAGWLACLE
ncbi:epoxide hydrolase [Platysternon megacephalum]|uniref:Epoxide hydrolase n=1 Tax=Platysternon megacephalum TaxID=55544 RepID=A0A4D9DCP9_9SAUR|nr:epoxide hydrolase [Platysternon megacephalum]